MLCTFPFLGDPKAVFGVQSHMKVHVATGLVLTHSENPGCEM